MMSPVAAYCRAHPFLGNVQFATCRDVYGADSGIRAVKRTEWSPGLIVLATSVPVRDDGRRQIGI